MRAVFQRYMFPSFAIPAERPLAKPSPKYYRRRLPHIHPGGSPAFITTRTFEWLILPPSARDLVLAHCLYFDLIKYLIHCLVVMPDHLHLLLSILRDPAGSFYSLDDVMGGIKGASSHSINKRMNRRGHVWQDESFDRVVRRDEDLLETAEYICQNPVRRGLVTSPDDYPWVWREWREGIQQGRRW